MMQRYALVSLLLFGCHHPSGAAQPEREYGYVHMETTGLTSGVMRPESSSSGSSKGQPDVTIVFAPDSDRDALNALNGLGAEVLLPNANGDGIVIVGVLDPTIRHTSTGPGKATSEPYQEFHLSRWYLRAPFLRRSIPTPDDAPVVQRDDQLRSDDFGGRVGGDLGRFVRKR